MVAQALTVIALGLLGLAGAAKVVSPAPTSRALQATRLPSSPGVTRVLGVAEIAAALVGLTLGGAAILPAAALYAGFAVFTLGAVRQQTPLQSCGCFGREDTPPSVIHLAYNGVATVALAWVAVAGSTPLPWNASPLEIVVYAGFGAAGVYTSYVLLTALPQTLLAARST